MYGLPETTTIKKQLPKAAIYRKFNLQSAAKDSFDYDISRLDIVAELTPNTLHLSAGTDIKSIYVIQIQLKRKDFSEQNLKLISKLINQNLIYALHFEDQVALAVYHDKLFQTEWRKEPEVSIRIQGGNLDAVYQNIITQIGNIEITESRTLDEQIAEDERVAKIQKEIEKLERMARKEVQPKRKFELHQKILRLKEEL